MNEFNAYNEFQKFMDAVGLDELPKDDVQYLEMRKAFAAGCITMFQTVLRFQEFDDDVAVQSLESIAKQLMTIKI